MAEAQDLSWGAEALWQRLEPLLPGLSVEVVAHAESTNSTLIERARRSSGQRDAPISRPGEFDPGDVYRTPLGRRSGDTQPCLLVAEHQSRGRGRMGQDWQSAPGASLTFSLALPYAPIEWSGLSLAVGVALAEALDATRTAPAGTPAHRIGLKWPNDLWLLESGSAAPGRKLGGVLIETVPVGQRRMCVVGIGLNVLPLLLEDLGTGYACLHEIDPQATAPSALARVAEPLVLALRRFEFEGFAAFEAAYARRDLLRGRAVTTTAPGVPSGLAQGVDAQGALCILAGGQVHQVIGGEVSVRPAAEDPQ